MSLKQRMEAAAEAVSGAGELTLEYFQKGVEVETKADLSPVTVADREAENFLVEFLASRFPGDGFLGEELGERPGSSGFRWVIDPIDGTKAFVHGVPLFGVLVGLEDPDREAVAGAICLPALGESIIAAKGEGCFWNGHRTKVSGVAALSAAFVVYGEEECFDSENTVEMRKRLHQSALLVRGLGDCYGHMLVATGRAEAMLDPIVSDWDSVAVCPIVEEAGGIFTDWAGHRTATGKSAISTNAGIGAEIRALVAEFS